MASIIASSDTEPEHMTEHNYTKQKVREYDGLQFLDMKWLKKKDDSTQKIAKCNYVLDKAALIKVICSFM